MTISRKKEREILKEKYLEKLMTFCANDEDVLRVKSNEFCFPVVGCNDNEDFIVITVKIPTGANKGTEPYDGYEMAEEYERKMKEKKIKAQKKEEEKKRKIERDKQLRAEKQAQLQKLRDGKL